MLKCECSSRSLFLSLHCLVSNNRMGWEWCNLSLWKISRQMLPWLSKFKLSGILSNQVGLCKSYGIFAHNHSQTVETEGSLTLFLFMAIIQLLSIEFQCITFIFCCREIKYASVNST